jgi:hypothetical protein
MMMTLMILMGCYVGIVQVEEDIDANNDWTNSKLESVAFLQSLRLLSVSAVVILCYLIQLSFLAAMLQTSSRIPKCA